MAPTFNAKSPTIKRIMREAAELSSNPSADYHAAPQEDDLYTWHFTIRGPSESAFSDGIYHGRITLPTTYPLKPPNFRFLTPSGRFECNREICLSISGFHEEMWHPAWGLRTALLALRSHMDVPAKGQVGGIESDDATRRRLAEASRRFTCSLCAKSNEAILEEQGELAANAGSESKEVEKVPEELRLAYREDLEDTLPRTSLSALKTADPSVLDKNEEELEPDHSGPAGRGKQVANVEAQPQHLPPPLVPLQPNANAEPQARRNDTDHQIDAAIWLVSALLIALVARWLLKILG